MCKGKSGKFLRKSKKFWERWLLVGRLTYRKSVLEGELPIDKAFTAHGSPDNHYQNHRVHRCTRRTQIRISKGISLSERPEMYTS